MDERAVLESVAEAAIKEVFTPEGQKQPYVKERALGVRLSQWCEWDCRRVFEVAYAMLEDSNMHTENAVLVEAAKLKGAIPADWK